MDLWKPVLLTGCRLSERSTTPERGSDPRPLWPGPPGQPKGSGQGRAVERAARALQGAGLPGGGAPDQPEAVCHAAPAAQEGASCSSMPKFACILVYLTYYTLNRMPLMVYPKVLFGVDIHRHIQCLASGFLLGRRQQTDCLKSISRRGFSIEKPETRCRCQCGFSAWPTPIIEHAFTCQACCVNRRA